MIRQRSQLVQTGYPNQSLNAAVSPGSTNQLFIESVGLYNGSPAANALAAGCSFVDSYWKLFGLRTSDTELTSSVQSGSAVSIFTTTNSEGMLVQCKEKFGAVSITISQASTGSPVYAYTYWNGSSFATLNLLNTPSYASAGQQTIVFAPPIDWATGDGSEDGDSSMYSIRVLATTAPSQAVQITDMKVVKIFAFREDVDSKGSVSINFPSPILLQQGEEILGFFKYPDSGNIIEASYRLSP